MRIAVISDIHGNCFALDAALADLARRSVDQTVCLGDAIQGGAQPAETVARLRALGCPVVMGNADAWLLTGRVTGEEPVTAEQEEVRQWSLGRLSADDQAFIASFAATVPIVLPSGRTLLCFHGSPRSFDEILLPSTLYADMQQALGPYLPAILTGGHTHLQQVRRLGASFFFNPGSIGVAYDHDQAPEDTSLDAWAEYAILSDTDGALGLEFRRVPYDADALRQQIAASGRPYAEKMSAQYR